MCRITGIWTDQNPERLSCRCEEMRDTLTQGGPDDAGLFCDRAAGLALGHRRLSIIDLTKTGHQPMTMPDHQYTICYNGEVYNYREIRKDLTSHGVRFRGSSDTEVVLNAFALWGPECVERFNGMFAFALWDSSEKALYLFRDRMGVKPLYYYNKNGTFAFASELKALHAGLGKKMGIDETALGEFFHYGYISAPRSIYKHTYKLEPGCWIRVSSDHTIEKHRYWSYPRTSERPFISDNEEALTDRLEEIMVDAFKKRLIADVPVGVFLSGGIDSSLVTAILAKHTKTPIKTFTIGFNEKNYDESRWARKIADHLKTEHTEQIVTPEHAREILPLWPEIYDEPFGDISGIPTTIVSRMTREHVKVSLSADGGDELFCGYHRYWVMQRLQERLQHLPPALVRAGGNLVGLIGADNVATMSQIIPRLRLPAIKDRFRKLQAVLEGWNGSAASSYPFAVGYWLPDEIKELTGCYSDPRPGLATSGVNSGGLVDAMMLWDTQHYLSNDILTKVDRATMSCGLEGRDPFLDHRIAEFAWGLPMQMKFHNGDMKYILKKLLGRYLPQKLFDRPKQGFAIPIYDWLHDDLMHMVDTYLNPDALRDQVYIDPDCAARTVSAFKHKNGSVAVDRIWLLLVFMMWRDRYGL
ncbi:MAG: asparagine synthase (glutamine-hydrolyzing) [Thermodesulfobacteriota bacterium]|nr:asparagine synthase (glutamine-hydrolyzing) [Thermodesulfobacteriota bacterium]